MSFSTKHVFTAIFIMFMAGNAYSLHFFLENGAKMCFIEQMPKYTVYLGNFTTSTLERRSGKYIYDPSVQIKVTVEAFGEVFMDQIIMASNGRFFFTSGDDTDYTVCLSAISDKEYGPKTLKTEFEVFTGNPGEHTIMSPVEARLTGMESIINQLNILSASIIKDQAQHRKRESEFREKSSYVNNHIVFCMIVQLTILLITCAWQMRHLKSFFRSKKLV